ncbi:acetaldehyde dehydrogenase / alcohol dehydrogenase [Actinopolyspora xinjiangensis]|uniref:Aldehyde-alcohol dehydrogenase n=1 Tax=Actinopolyspora xinjiangensis TaxID=405564 RepID=A0A1H0QPS3_9ACTN|nr:acetaldehyde dehydrogenase / alcohol dehydrogenase [Actinopolyspora xinjiangensis]
MKTQTVEKFNSVIDRSSTGTEPEKVVDELVSKAMEAQSEFARYEQEEVDHIVKKASLGALRRHTELARLAVSETGRGIAEDKAIKNMYACEHVTHRMAGLKTAGVIRRDEMDGVVEIADPVGVIAAVTPVTNPTSTVIFKSLIALKTRNPIVFAFNRRAQECCTEAARSVRDAAVAAGAPENCISWIETPSRAATTHLMRHDGIAINLTTGSHGLVRAAYSSGKPALGVGAANVPVYVNAGADLARATHDLVLSKSFDNGLICSSEQTLILDEEIADSALEELRKLHAYVATPSEKLLLERYLFSGGDQNGSCTARGTFNAEAAGQSARHIAKRAGFEVPADTSVILAEVSETGPSEPLAQEKLCPVLSVIRVSDSEHGLRRAEQILANGGNGHTAVIHTDDSHLAERFGHRVKAARIVWNSPSSHGGIGDIYNAFLPSLTLGAGASGGNSVSGNVHAIHLVDIKRIGRRNTNMQWFKVPPKIYFEPYSIRYLSEMAGLKRVAIITGPNVRRAGHVKRVRDALAKRSEPVDIDIIDDIEPNPSIDTVRRHAQRMRTFEPDTIIALGGGSPIDAAKVIWLLYEHPDVDFGDMREKFFDIRKRVFRFPEPGKRAKLVCVPTTAGTGAEVSPFSVITDPETGRKYPLTDYALTPSVAICDPTFTTDLPPSVTADTGFDALTHAIEAYVSVYANDFTDGLCLKAIRLIFDHLERAVTNGAHDPAAREAMHNAGTIAGMSFGNAFLGVVHAMAHTLGATFHIAHGRTNAVLLPHVIRYNGTTPGKFTGWPKYDRYTAPERFQEIARFLGLPANTPDVAVEQLALAVEDLRDRSGIEPSFQAMGISPTEFLNALPQQAINAYNDQCAPANPRLPMFTEIENLMRTAYYGKQA